MPVLEKWTVFDGEYLPIELAWFLVEFPETDGDNEGYVYTGEMKQRLILGYAEYNSDGTYYIDGIGGYRDLQDEEAITHWTRTYIPDFPKE